MTPAQHAAYEAVCSADPECRCPLVYFDGHAGFGAGAWRDTDDSLVALAIAAVAITDRLHTRLEVGREWPSKRWHEVYYSTDKVWVADQTIDHGDDEMMMEQMVEHYRGHSKLSAYLAAHCVRLSLPRELIQKMEEA